MRVYIDGAFYEVVSIQFFRELVNVQYVDPLKGIDARMFKPEKAMAFLTWNPQ